jgi:hypothetical protein
MPELYGTNCIILQNCFISCIICMYCTACKQTLQMVGLTSQHKNKQRSIIPLKTIIHSGQQVLRISRSNLLVTRTLDLLVTHVTSNLPSSPLLGHTLQTTCNPQGIFSLGYIYIRPKTISPPPARSPPPPQSLSPSLSLTHCNPPPSHSPPPLFLFFFLSIYFPNFLAFAIPFPSITFPLSRSYTLSLFYIFPCCLLTTFLLSLGFKLFPFFPSFYLKFDRKCQENIFCLSLARRTSN